MDAWVAAGAKGWDFATVDRCIDKLRNTIQPVCPKRHRNKLVEDWVKTASKVCGVPIIEDFNKTMKEGVFKEGELDQIPI